MNEAESMDLKKLLMRYRRLKTDISVRDKHFILRLTKNYFSCIRKAGPLMKRSETSYFNKWENRYVVLTNAGFVYFGSKSITSDEDIIPKKFKPLNDFVVADVPPNVSPICKRCPGVCSYLICRVELGRGSFIDS